MRSSPLLGRKWERLAKKEMGQLLYLLREKLRAQGSRNDLRDRDKGFGAWVEETIEVSRRTADRWADEYGLANGLMKRKSTSRQDDQKSFVHEDDKFLEEKRRKHGRQIQMNYWVPLAEYQRHEQSVKVLKKHFKTNNIQEAIVKGVQYAAQALALGRGRTNRNLLLENDPEHLGLSKKLVPPADIGQEEAHQFRLGQLLLNETCTSCSSSNETADSYRCCALPNGGSGHVRSLT